jgi:hypothetical protein
MSSTSYTHHVYVDFENVSDLDLGILEGKPARVTLLIGKNQAKLDYVLVEQIHRLAAQVCLVKLGVSGRNALDLSLAFYLGKTVQAHPELSHCVLSKDKDFDSMISHLNEIGVQVSRHESMESLPFIPKPKKSPPAKVSSTAKPTPVSKAGVSVTLAAPAQSLALEEDETAARFEKLIHLLRGNPAPKPKTKSRLLAFIGTVFGQKLNLVGQEQKLAELEKRGIVSIDAKGKVTYAKHA